MRGNAFTLSLYVHRSTHLLKKVLILLNFCCVMFFIQLLCCNFCVDFYSYHTKGQTDKHA